MTTETNSTTCDATAEACVCNKHAGHADGDDVFDRPHLCDCGGSWNGKLDSPDFEIVSWPDSNPDWEVPA